jgi:hypothetical protein
VDLPGTLNQFPLQQSSSANKLGFRDVNLARVQVAEKYIQLCDQVLIVARIGRVITDAFVKETLERYTPKPSIFDNTVEGDFKFAIVCTASEVSTYGLLDVATDF